MTGAKCAEDETLLTRASVKRTDDKCSDEDDRAFFCFLEGDILGDKRSTIIIAAVLIAKQ